MLSNRQLFLNYLAQTSPEPVMLEIKSAKGIYLLDPSGKKYIDLISGVSVSALGHGHPEVIKSIKSQLDKHMHIMVYGEFIQSPQVEYAHNLCETLGPGFENVYFVNSGAEAIEGAIKVSRKFTGKSEIISFENAYHGSTLGALSVMGGNNYKKGFYPLIPDTRRIKFNCLAGLLNITSNTACVIVEPVQAEAGVILPENGFLEKIRQRCDETGALLVFDEIQTGFGRTGEMFAFQKYGVKPDIIVLAKSLGGGMPLGAFISRKEIMHCLGSDPALGHITTFGGHPVSCKAGLCTLEIIKRDSLHKTVLHKEKLIRENLKHPGIKEIRGTGLLLAIDLGTPEMMHKMVKSALKNGIITDWFLFCDEAIRVSPPLNITDEEILEACRLLKKSLDQVF
jgi:acetylornithine/N-succinyldiaminopimelate aminotransferase